MPHGGQHWVFILVIMLLSPFIWIWDTFIRKDK